MSALERWYDRASASLKQGGSRARRKESSSESTLEDTDLDVLQAALTQVVATVDAAERAQALAEVLRQLKWSTGLTLTNTTPLSTRRTILYKDDKAIKARDLLSTRGLTLLPVLQSKEEGGVMGVVDMASIRYPSHPPTYSCMHGPASLTLLSTHLCI